MAELPKDKAFGEFGLFIWCKIISKTEEMEGSILYYSNSVSTSYQVSLSRGCQI